MRSSAKRSGSSASPTSITKASRHAVATRKRAIRGYQSFTDYFGVAAKAFDETGAFNPILNLDSPLMIDPKLLDHSRVKEMKNTYARILEHFRSILKLLLKSQSEKDKHWLAAYELTDFSEFKGVALGYSRSSSNGKGWASKLRLQILRSAKIFAVAGVEAPEMFELLALFEPGIGSDRISDMIGTILLPILCAYTKRVCSKLKVPLHTFTIKGSPHKLPFFVDPVAGEQYIILVPRDILSDLPLALHRGDISDIAMKSSKLRQHLNLTVGDNWTSFLASEKGKALTRALFVENPKLLRAKIDAYREAVAKSYDFSRDDKNVHTWYKYARLALVGKMIRVKPILKPKPEQLRKVVRQVLHAFKESIESPRMRRLVFIDGHLRDESALRSIFMAFLRQVVNNNSSALIIEDGATAHSVEIRFVGTKYRVVISLKVSNSGRLTSALEKLAKGIEGGVKQAHIFYLVLHVPNTASEILKLKRSAVMAKFMGACELLEVDVFSTH